MSYKSLKRVLGETSLERKCRFLFGGCLLLLIISSFLWHSSQTEKLVRDQGRNTGRLLVDQVMCVEHWEKLETYDEFKKVVSELTNKLSQQEYVWRFIRPNDTEGSGAPRDEFEQKVLERFLKARPDPKADREEPMFAERSVPERKEYQYYQPIRAQESCLLVCHRPPPGGTGIDPAGSGFALGGGVVSAGAPLSEGDLMAVVQVTIPNETTLNALARNRAILLATAFITVFLAMIASYLIIRYVIVKPLKHLRDVSDAISHGNISLRAEIHTSTPTWTARSTSSPRSTCSSTK